MRQRRITGTEDGIATKLNVQLLLERVLNVNLCQDSESFFLKSGGDLLQRFLKRLTGKMSLKSVRATDRGL